MLDPEELFKAYKWQLIGECYATGIDTGIIISFHPDFPDDKKIVEYEYTANPEDFEALEERLEECKDLLLSWIGESVIEVNFR